MKRPLQGTLFKLNPLLEKLSVLRDLRLRTRMLLLMITVLGAFALTTAIELYVLHQVKVGGGLYGNIKNNYSSQEVIGLLKSDLNQVRAEAFAMVNEDNKDKLLRTKEDIERLEQNIETRFSAITTTLCDDEEKLAIKDAETTWDEFEKTLNKEIIPALMRGEKAHALDLLKNVQTLRYQRFIEQIDIMVDTLGMETAELESTAAETIAAKIGVTLLFSALISVFVFILAYFITQSVTSPILRGVNFAKSVSHGNLSEKLEISGKDEIGNLAESLNGMVNNLNLMVGKITRTSDSLSNITGNLDAAARRVLYAADLQSKGVAETSSAVQQIKASIHSVADGVDSLSISASESSSSILEMAASIEEVALNMENLSHSVEEVSASIIEMASSIKQIGSSVENLVEASSTTASSIAQMDVSIKEVEKSVSDAAEIAEEVRADAQTGKDAVDAVIAGMGDIRNSSAITSQVVETLWNKVEDIGSITSVIDEVAEQTNLLALNAAIIAAQAGVHGKGFAVVADEIKELAERTSASTREITNLIQAVQLETQRAVDAIDDAEKKISDGEVISYRSGEALQKIVKGIGKSSQQIRSIARATVEQARGSHAIREAAERVSVMVSQIGNATREQTKGSEQIMMAVEQMKSLSFQVLNSTREQKKVGSFIARSTENITSRIDQIKTACAEQTKGSSQIVGAVEDIQETSVVNADAAKTMNEAVAALSKEIETLQTEIKNFRV